MPGGDAPLPIFELGSWLSKRHILSTLATWAKAETAGLSFALTFADASHYALFDPLSSGFEFVHPLFDGFEVELQGDRALWERAVARSACPLELDVIYFTVEVDPDGDLFVTAGAGKASEAMPA